MSYSIEKINGVTKKTRSAGFEYDFPTAIIVTDTTSDNMTILPKNSNAQRESVAFSDLTDDFSAADIEAYVDELAYRGFFFERPTQEISTGNSTTSTLSTEGVFTGTEDFWGDYPSMMLIIYADVPGSYTIQIAQDVNGASGNYSTVGSYNYRADGTDRPHVFQIGSRWVKITYTNGATGQTTFQMSCLKGDFRQITAPGNGTYTRDTDTIPVMPLDTKLAIAKSQFDGILSFDKFGFNGDIDTASAETLWSQGGTWIPMTSGQAVNIVSSSANDDDGASGANTIRVYGIDAATGAPTTEDVTMNGTTPVPTSTSWRGINRMQVLTTGVTGSNEGNITATADTDTTVQAQIPAGWNITQQCVMTLPTTHDAYIGSVEVQCFKTSGGSAPKVTIDVYYQNSDGIAYRVIRQFIDVEVNPIWYRDFENKFKVPAGSYWWITIETDTNNTYARGYIGQTLVATS